MSEYGIDSKMRFLVGANTRPGIRSRKEASLRPGPETVVPVQRSIDAMLESLIPAGPIDVTRMTAAELTEFQQREADRILALSGLVQRQADLASRPLPPANMGGKKVKGTDDED